MSRKRKISTHETLTTTGNKIIKVVRSNSVVYKKVDQNAPTATNQAKVDKKQNENVESRKRTLSERSDVLEVQEDELVDNCYEFKRIKIIEKTSKPKLIRNRHLVRNKNSNESDAKEDELESISNKTDNDSDSEVQIVSVEIADVNTNIDSLSDSEVIEVVSSKLDDPIDIVDLSDDEDECVSIYQGTELDLGVNVPDVVASCHKKIDTSEKDILNDIDAILDDDL